ncbi:hypothetical protein Kim5_CH00760 [Rhizobium sp. Kim5]|uniref:hypothetical protein n=1 Tax=Rhizobium sp. Kim5 TaxID=2020311 RepID=UPI00019047F8|nr:hypothetical protein [Rhizobium sp. Kim5]ARQ56868.1 hypothetical protein Kim5_CH00760 [Rhizobium sp. Kim5]
MTTQKSQGTVKNRTFSKRLVVLLILLLQPMAAFSMYLNPTSSQEVFGIYVGALLALGGMYMGVGAWDLKTMIHAGLFNVTRGKPHD